MQNHPAAWTGKPHFMALAAQAMRRILADYGRSRGAEKRSAFSNAVPLELAKDMAIAPGRSVELVDLDDALTKLAEFDPESAKVVEMRYFGGLTEGEIGELLGCSSRTVKRKWEKARAWLSEVLRP
jgi:RNA polymerase sigma factor (TIGR02999 family)